MNKREALRDFKELYPASTFKSSGGGIDLPALRETWTVYLDSLRRDGCITQEQYAAWDPPRVRTVHLQHDEVLEVRDAVEDTSSQYFSRDYARTRSKR